MDNAGFMNVLVVEEEQRKINELTEILRDVGNGIRITGISPDLLQSRDWFSPENIPDLILVNADIVKNEKTRHLLKGKVKTMVTLSTRSDEYSFQAFRFKAIESLLQPAITSTNKKLVPGYKLFQARVQHPFRNRFLVKQGQKLLSVSVDDIAYFFSDNRFIFFKTLDAQKFMVEYRMDELERMLDTAKFFRITRSFIVSINSIQHIHPYFGNRLKLSLHPPFETDLVVSRERVQNFKAWAGE